MGGGKNKGSHGGSRDSCGGVRANWGVEEERQGTKNASEVEKNETPRLRRSPVQPDPRDRASPVQPDPRDRPSPVQPDLTVDVDIILRRMMNDVAVRLHVLLTEGVCR